MRIHPLRTLAVALLGILALLPQLATAQQGHAPLQVTPSASPVAPSAAEWTAAVLKVDGSPVTMSPDGAMVAGIGPEHQLCVWHLPALDATCKEPSERNINPDSIVWSPDGTAIAYTLDAFLRGDESDLFVFELETATSTNLTDDGVEGSLFNSDDSAPQLIDVMPTWTHDGQSLLFVRSDFSTDDPDTDLMTISRQGGAPVLLETVSDYPFAIFTRMHLLADGSLVYSLGPGNIDDPDTGIWLRTPDGEHGQVLAGDSSTDFPLPIVTDVHEGDGGVLVAAYSYPALAQRDLAAPLSFVLDLGTGDVMPLELVNPLWQIGPTVFSSDGATLFSVALGGEDDTLVITHDGEQEMIELGVGGEAGSRPVRLYGGIELRGDGTLFIPNAMASDPYIVTLGA